MTHTMTTDVKLLHPKAVLPTYGTDYAAGADMACVAGTEGLTEKFLNDPSNDEVLDAWVSFEYAGYTIIYPGQSYFFRLGFAAAMNPDYWCLLLDRSSMGGKRVIGRLAGVIDSDYRGEWFVRLVNFSREPQKIMVGDKIIQGVFQERVRVGFNLVGTLSSTERGEAGHGSTGR